MTESFGKYDLIEPIGKGGMAEVYRARSVGAEGVEKTLVIKRILPELATNDRFVEMFISEAKIAMGLNHPNIVQIYDFGKVGSDYYLAMEYVDGVELGRLLEASRQVDRPLPVGDAVYLAMEVARGLDYAHRRTDAHGRQLGLVHCDISPENLMISRDGALKILDFGIARVSAAGADDDEEFKGKYRYMSPEQVRGNAVDRRSDLFSLAAVLFEMVCGRPLFRGENPQETISLVSSAVVPDILSINPDVPRPLEHAMYKGLARKADERFDTARAFQAELTKVLYGLDEIHDATTVAEHLDGVEQALPNDSRELWLPDEQDDGTRAKTARTGPGKTPGQALTPAVKGGPQNDALRRQTVMERKEIVALVGDLQGLETDDSKGHRVDEYRRIIDSISYKNNGVVHRIDATGFAVLLGIPVSDENDAQRAARMAFDIEDAISEIGFGTDRVLHIRFAIVIGEVILEEVVVDGERHYEWIVEQSSKRAMDRALTESETGEITVDAQMYRRIQRSFSCEPLDVEGDETAEVATEDSLYRLRKPKSARAQIRELRESFHSLYGREIQRRLLRDTFRQTLIGEQARALLIVGRTGVGKSTLVEEFLAGLNPREVQVVRGVASPFNRDVPLASAEALFAEMMQLDPGATAQKTRRQLDAGIEAVFSDAPQQERKLVQEALYRLFGLTEQGDDSEGALTGVERRRRLFVTLQKLTTRMGRQRPLVLAIDDVHHIDPVMMTFAAQYFNRSHGAPVLFVGTGRDTGPHVQTHAWQALMEARNLKVESLGELARPEAERMVRDLLDHHDAESQRVVELVLDRSGGNPLYIKEVIDALVRRGLLDRSDELTAGDGADELLPPSVEGLVRARIDQLETDERDAIRRLSVLPSPFSLRQARAVIDGPCASLLDRFVDAELLLCDQREAGEAVFRFASAVTREMAQRSLVDDEAQALHRRIADHLLAHRERYDSALIARHLDAAGESIPALEHYEEAVEDAFRQFGADQCLQLCDRILDHPQVDDERRFRVLQWKEAALREIGDADRRRRTLEDLQALAPDVGDARERVDVAIRGARFWIAEGQFDQARQAVENAHQMAADGDDRLGMADAWRVEAIVNLHEGRRDRALALIDRALATLTIGGDRRSRTAMVEAYNVRGVILRQSGRHREALEAYETALAAVSGMESTTLRRQLLINSGLALAYVGEFSEAERRSRRALQACQRLGHRRHEAMVWVNLGHVYQMMGRYARAAESARRGIYLARSTESTTTVADGRITLGLTFVEQGEVRKGRSFLEKGLRVAEKIPNVYLTLCAQLGLVQVDLASDRPAHLRRALERARKVRETSTQTGMMWGEAMAHELLAQGYRRRDEAEKAWEHSQRAVDLIDEIDLLGVDQVLVTHAELLADRPDEQGRRRDFIERAGEVYEARLDALDDEESRRAFSRRPLNQKIQQLQSEVGIGAH